MSITDDADAIAACLRNGALPVPHMVELRSNGTPIRIQTVHASDVAVWAERYGMPVVLSERTTYIDVRAHLTMRGQATEVWAQLTHAQAFRLLHGSDSVLTEPNISVDPAVLLETAPAAGG